MKTTKLMYCLLAVGIGACLPIIVSAEDPAKQPGPDQKKDKPPVVAGEIVTIDSKSVQVKSKRGETVTLLLADTTLYGNKKEPKQFSDFKVGDMIVVGYQKSDDGKLTATRVMNPPPKGEKGDKPQKKKAAGDQKQ